MLASFRVAIAQTQIVTLNNRFFTATQPMSLAPKFSSKFVDKDYLLCLADSFLYTCQKTGPLTQVWNPIIKLSGGSGGGGGTTTVVGGGGLYISPDSCGAVHSNQTFAGAGKNQAYIDANYPGIGATTTDCIDWAAWQKAVNISESTGLPVWCYGSYWVNKPITISKTNLNLTIYGNNSLITTTNNTNYAVFQRPSPSNMTDANLMVESKYVIKNIRLTGNSNQRAFDLGPGYGQWFEGIRMTGFGTGILLRFALNTMVHYCYDLAWDI